MTITRGDVVLLDFPFAGGAGSKVRPALVVQNDPDNRRLNNSIVVMITSRTDRAAAEPTQVLIELATADGAGTGLLMDSAVNCANVFTVDKRRMLRVIGGLPPSLMQKVDHALKAALAIG